MMKVTHKKQNKETGSRKSQKMRSVFKQQTAPVKTHRTALRQKTNQEGQYEERKKDKSDENKPPSRKSKRRQMEGTYRETIKNTRSG